MDWEQVVRVVRVERGQVVHRRRVLAQAVRQAGPVEVQAVEVQAVEVQAVEVAEQGERFCWRCRA